MNVIYRQDEFAQAPQRPVATMPVREELMPNLKQVVRLLNKERAQTHARLTQLDSALKALGDVATYRSSSKRGRVLAETRKPMSAAARKRIAAAQRARWAKWRAAQKNK